MDISNDEDEQGENREYRENRDLIFKNNWDEILKDRVFSNILINRKWAAIDILIAHDKLKKVLDKSQRLIQNKLDKSQ
jgi:hypothetical protein